MSTENKLKLHLEQRHFAAAGGQLNNNNNNVNNNNNSIIHVHAREAQHAAHSNLAPAAAVGNLNCSSPALFGHGLSNSPSAFAPPSSLRTSPPLGAQLTVAPGLPLSNHIPSVSSMETPTPPGTTAPFSGDAWLLNQLNSVGHRNSVLTHGPSQLMMNSPPAAAAAVSSNPPVFLLGQHRIVTPLSSLLSHSQSPPAQSPSQNRDMINYCSPPGNNATVLKSPAQYMSHFTTTSDPTNTAAQSQKKKRVYRARHLVCANSRCKTANTPLWRKGWVTADGKTNAMLCNACGLHYKKGHFCSYCQQIYKEADAEDSVNPFVTCSRCSRWLHLKCAQARRLPDDIRKEKELGIRPPNLCQECLDLKMKDLAAFEGESVVHKRRKKLHADTAGLDAKKLSIDSSLSMAVPVVASQLSIAKDLPISLPPVIAPLNLQYAPSALGLHSSYDATVGMIPPVRSHWTHSNPANTVVLQPQPMRPSMMLGVQSSPHLPHTMTATPSQSPLSNGQISQSDVVSDSSCSSTGSSPTILPVQSPVNRASLSSKTIRPSFQDMLVVDRSIRPASIPGQVFHPAIGNPLDCLSAACEIERTTACSD